MIELQTFWVVKDQMNSFISAWNEHAMNIVNQRGIRIGGAWIVEGAHQVLAILEYSNAEGLNSAASALTSLLPGVTRVERRRLEPAMADPRFARVVMEEDRSLANPLPSPWQRVEIVGDPPERTQRKVATS